MDLVKIGKYIAGKRKGLGLTQKQLAEKLGMSDKSVSKWERGICLPDVSVYSDLCLILGITLNEFLAGEDIAQENIIQKAEENILGVTTDSTHKQNRLKIIIGVLLAITIIPITVIVVSLYHVYRPQNVIAAVDQNSVEMQTANLLAGPDGAHIYKFITSDNYDHINLYLSEYQSGELIRKDNCCEIGFGDIVSPKNGEILIIPDFLNFFVKVVVSADGATISTELPILRNVANREYYGRSATEIRDKIDIEYDEEQALLALIYDDDVMSVPGLNDIINGQADILLENDYVYCFSFEFCK